MKKSSVAKLVLSSIMAVGLLSSTLITNHANAQSVDSPSLLSVSNPSNQITANGNGSIKVKPDLAIISLGVQTSDAVAKTAQTKNSEAMDKVIKALKAMGVSDKDMQTSNYNMYPNYSYGANGEAKPNGYNVSNNVTIKVRNITNVGAIIDAATAAGANTSNGIQFTVENTDAYYKDALVQAISNAESKAKVIAPQIKANLGKVTSVVEQSSQNVTPIYRESAKLAADSAATPVQEGMVEVTAAVVVTYSFTN